MVFKIKHENVVLAVIFVIPIVILMLMLMLMMLIPDIPKEVIKGVIIADMTLMTACLFLYVLEQLMGTVVCIEDRKLIIKALFIAKSIAVDDICDLEIKRYYRITRNGSEEYRVSMTIYLTNDKEIILTDAGGKRPGMFYKEEPLPDGDIPLYQLYQVLYSMLPTE